MQKFIKHFVRERQGVWSCVEAVEVHLPHGRIQVSPGTRFTLGSTFMGVEVAQLLEEQYEAEQQ